MQGWYHQVRQAGTNLTTTVLRYKLLFDYGTIYIEHQRFVINFLSRQSGGTCCYEFLQDLQLFASPVSSDNSIVLKDHLKSEEKRVST